MTLRHLVLTLAIASLLPLISLSSASAEPTPVSVAAPSEQATNLPNLLSLGAGWYDFNQNSPRREAIDFRLEHRWGMSLLPKASNYFSSWDKYFQIHPIVALETSSREQFYGGAGFAFDILLGRHFVITPTELVGLYYRGDGKRLGSFVEFRSTLEGGYRFDNEMRLTAFIGHMSNAHLTNLNPGANTVGGYLHIPTSMLCGK